MAYRRRWRAISDAQAAQYAPISGRLMRQLWLNQMLRRDVQFVPLTGRDSSTASSGTMTQVVTEKIWLPAFVKELSVGVWVKGSTSSSDWDVRVQLWLDASNSWNLKWNSTSGDARTVEPFADFTPSGAPVWRALEVTWDGAGLPAAANFADDLPNRFELRGFLQRKTGTGSAIMQLREMSFQVEDQFYAEGAQT